MNTTLFFLLLFLLSVYVKKFFVASEDCILRHKKKKCCVDWTVWNEPTDNRLQSEHPASLWPALRAASPWQFTRPADTMRFVRAGQLPLSRCAQPPHGRWDLQHWLWWVAERRPNVTARCIDRVLGLQHQILTTLYLFSFRHIFNSRPFLNQRCLPMFYSHLNITPSIIYLGFFVYSF